MKNLAPLATVVLFVTAANAEIFHVEAVGQGIYAYYDTGPVLPFDASANEFRFSFDLDTAVPDSRPEDTQSGLYLNALSNTSLIVDGATVPTWSDTFVAVNNDTVSGDEWIAVTRFQTPPDGTGKFRTYQFGLRLLSPNTAFASDTLIPPVVDPAADGPMIYSVFDRTPPISITGIAEADINVDTVTVTATPLPAVGWLLAPAFGLIGFKRRKAIA